MIQIRLATINDIKYWRKYDTHICIEALEKCIQFQQGYVLVNDTTVLGILRFSYFWYSIPFLDLIYIDNNYQKLGYGTKLLNYWEQIMKEKGYSMVLTSTQMDESAQHFYRKLNYHDCGYIDFKIEPYTQPRELILCKSLNDSIIKNQIDC